MPTRQGYFHTLNLLNCDYDCRRGKKNVTIAMIFEIRESLECLIRFGIG